MGLMQLREEHRERLNGSRSLVDDRDISILLSQLHAVIKAAVRDGIREALLDIPGVRAVQRMKKAAHRLKVKLTRRSN